MNSAYSKLIEKTRESALLSSTSALMAWDQEVLMPGKSVEYRAKARAEKDFERFRPWLERMITLMRRTAAHLGTPEGGEAPDSSYLIRYLTNKLRPIYGLS